jgi:hypothetical protein
MTFAFEDGAYLCTSIKFAFGNFRELRQVVKQTSLQRLVSMNGHGESNDASALPENVMTTGGPKDLPAVPFEQARELLA